MSISFGSANTKELDIDAIREVINGATFSSEIVTAKGAPNNGPRSKYADQPPVDPKYQRVNSSVTLDIGSLPLKESRFVLDAFDRFATHEPGKLILKENCALADFDKDRVFSQIQDYAHKKINKLVDANHHLASESSLPKQVSIPQNESVKPGLLGWLKEAIRPSSTPGLGR